ncbi:Aldo/keto reductase [Teratosphaeria nubilosa]|uniref:Aldo/keto reductase n=1 Tax=Teratosphaeria nubilosa TaxID=161662 RepID=A0A6G1LF99_9PEZI|nr:Aldo/keto reductase [Teratosphaeria nubilosa]
MSLPKSFSLRAADGKTVEIPSVGYGTWASGDTSWAKDATLTALKAGYRHLDCAWMYGVDEAVGEAIRESGVPRSEIFITSKSWPHFGHPDNVELCLDKILQNMGLDYIDLYLAHWPHVLQPISRSALETAFSHPTATPHDRGILQDANGKQVLDHAHCPAHIARAHGHQGTFAPTFQAMQALVRKGKTRTIGVSNFSIQELQELLPLEADVPLSVNQVEVHPWLPQHNLISFAREHGILTTCYSPFAGQKTDGRTLLRDEGVVGVARRNGMDVGQVLQSWAVQRGTVPLGKSATAGRIRSNLDVKKLCREDMEALDGLAMRGDEGRTVDFREEWGIPLFED